MPEQAEPRRDAGGFIAGGQQAIDASANPCWSAGSVISAFGQGFLAGGAGSLAGLMAGGLSGFNPYVMGGTAGLVSGAVSQQCDGDISVPGLAASAGLGLLGGGIASRLFLIKPGSFMPNLFKPRPLGPAWGPNSQKLPAQEMSSSILGGAAGAAALPSRSGELCGCP